MVEIVESDVSHHLRQSLRVLRAQRKLHSLVEVLVS